MHSPIFRLTLRCWRILSYLRPICAILCCWLFGCGLCGVLLLPVWGCCGRSKYRRIKKIYWCLSDCWDSWGNPERHKKEPAISVISTGVSVLDINAKPRYCPACRTSLIATRFWVVVICPIIKCLTVLEFSFILFDLCLFITIFNFILYLCTYCNILDIYLS